MYIPDKVLYYYTSWVEIQEEYRIMYIVYIRVYISLCDQLPNADMCLAPAWPVYYLRIYRIYSSIPNTIFTHCMYSISKRIIKVVKMC